jgi:hypothetical protein
VPEAGQADIIGRVRGLDMNRGKRRAAFIGTVREVRHRPPASVKLHIGELVLHGVKSSDRHRVGEFMRAELESKIASNTLPANWDHSINSRSLDAGNVRLPSGSNARAFGHSIARAVYGALQR